MTTNNHNSNMEDEVPVFYMPIAAFLGLLLVHNVLKLLYNFYSLRSSSAQTPQRRTSTTPPTSIHWTPWILSTILIGLAYAFCVAKIERVTAEHEYKLFDPYELLALPSATTNSTLIKAAYRQMAKVYHPDKNPGHEQQFLKISQAYRALTEPTAMNNYKAYGHPDGPLQHPVFSLAIPHWLLFPQGKVAASIMIVYFAFLLYLAFVVIQNTLTAKHPQKKKPSVRDTSVSKVDLAHLAHGLRPHSNTWDILIACLTTPETLEWAQDDYDQMMRIRQQRQADIVKEHQQSTQSSQNAFDDLVNSDGWDDDADEQTELAQQEEEQKRRDMERLKQSTGQQTYLIEGLDHGVLGQEWVTRTLKEQNVWPKNNAVSNTVESVAAQRMLCMTVGRLNSFMLNSHPLLLEAGSKKKIDQTYFKSSMEFRQRMGMLLEAALRVGVTVRCQPLVSNIIDAIREFKVGATSEKTSWFHKQLQTNYGILPSLRVVQTRLHVPGQEWIGTSDKAELEVEVERMHGEQFAKHKLAQFKAQGIPAQTGMQMYREGWWFLVRLQKMDGGQPLPVKPLSDETVETLSLSPEAQKRFGDCPDQLLTAWPVFIQNLAQKNAKVKVHIPSPELPGKYKYIFDVKSQDFLGCDQTFDLEIDVVNSKSIPRSQEPKKEK